MSNSLQIAPLMAGKTIVECIATNLICKNTVARLPEIKSAVNAIKISLLQVAGETKFCFEYPHPLFTKVIEIIIHHIKMCVGAACISSNLAAYRRFLHQFFSPLWSARNCSISASNALTLLRNYHCGYY